MSSQIAIVERGRGPQLSTSRITVMDVFYYLHRGHDFDFIHEVMPSLTRPEFDAIASYVAQHQTELVEKDQRAELYQQRCKDELRARGLYQEDDETLTLEVRLDRLRALMKNKVLEQKNGNAAG
jgi:uncharacterized protein (DUF433 family)